MSPVEHELLTTAQAAHVAGVAEKTIRRWAIEGRLPYVALPSGRRRYRLSDLVATSSPTAETPAA